MFWNAPPLLPIGSPAPDFSVQDHLGRTVRRADLLGHRTILYWYPKADTPGCTREACSFRDHAAQLGGARVYGVSFDTPEKNRAFAEKFGLSFPLLCDTTREMSVAFHVCKSRRAWFPRRITYVLAADGTIESAERVGNIGAHVEATVARAKG
jgi:peroxiredoxin Q/BCP